MALGDYLKSHTHRQHLTWLAWLEMQWDLPDRHDNYLMRIGYEIRCAFAKSPSSVKMVDFYLPLCKARKKAMKRAKDKAKETTTLTKEAATQIAQAKWFALAGLPRGYKGPLERVVKQGGQVQIEVVNPPKPHSEYQKDDEEETSSSPTSDGKEAGKKLDDKFAKLKQIQRNRKKRQQ